MEPLVRFSGIDLMVACDVDTKFLEAPAVFGPQKGATKAQIELLERRLGRLSDLYLEEYGTNVTALQHSGAAGGLAGGLAAIGAQLVNGFELIAEEVALEDAMSAADIVITGEGRLDTESFNGKVVGGVVAMAKECQIPVVAVVGSCDPGVVLPDDMTVHSLVENFGPERAYDQTTRCLTNLGPKILTDL